VAGLENKDKEFWIRLKEWDIMVLFETWLDDRGWKRVKERLPGGYEWGMQAARRRNKKGRAIEGLVMGIKKELMEREERIGGGRGVQGECGGGEMEDSGSLCRRGHGEGIEGARAVGGGQRGRS